MSLFGPDEEEEISDAETLTTSSDSEESLDEDFEDLTDNLSSSEESDKDQVKINVELVKRDRQRTGTEIKLLRGVKQRPGKKNFELLREVRQRTGTEHKFFDFT